MKKVVLCTAAIFNLLLFIPAYNLLSFPAENPTINFESMFNKSIQYIIDENYTKAITGFEKLDSIDNKNSNITTLEFATCVQKRIWEKQLDI